MFVRGGEEGGGGGGGTLVCVCTCVFSCAMRFPEHCLRLVACMCAMSMRDVVVESPFVSLLVRPMGVSCLCFPRHVFFQ